MPLCHEGECSSRLSFSFGVAGVQDCISNQKFDVLLDEQQCTNQAFERILPVATETLYYLHLKSGATLLELTLTPVR